MIKKLKKKIKEISLTQELLAEVSEDNVFRCCDGKVLRNLKDLSDALSMMTDETYAYHCNGERQDLSNWVRNIIGDVELADDLELATSRSLAAWEVATRIAFLTNHYLLIRNSTGGHNSNRGGRHIMRGIKSHRKLKRQSRV